MLCKLQVETPSAYTYSLFWAELSRLLGEKIPVAIVGLEPGTPGSVVQRFNHLATKQHPPPPLYLPVQCASSWAWPPWQIPVHGRSDKKIDLRLEHVPKIISKAKKLDSIHAVSLPRPWYNEAENTFVANYQSSQVSLHLHLNLVQHTSKLAFFTCT